MIRLGTVITAAGLALAMTLAPLADASAQRGEGKKKAAPAARSAPAARAAPAARPAPQRPAARQAPQRQRPVAAPRRAPPSVSQPRQAAPRSAPARRQAAPAARQAPAAAARTEQRRQRIEQQRQRQQDARQPRTTPRATEAPNAAAERARQAGEQRQQRVQEQRQQRAQQRLDRLQKRQESGTRLNRAQQRELQRLQTQQRELQGQEQRQTEQPRQQGTRQATQDSTERLQQLQKRSGRLNRAERRELQRLQRVQRQEQQQQLDTQQTSRSTDQRLQQLQQQQQSGRLTRAEQRELRRLQRAQQQGLASQPSGEQRQLQREQRRALRSPRVTQEQAVQGRFAATGQQAWTRAGRDWRERRAANRSARLAARAAWRLGLLATYVPWHGPVYWPYAYTDVFYYTFWPDAYEPFYWAYVYDDFFDGIFFPYGAPYVEEVYAGPYGPPYRAGTTGSTPSREPPGRVTRLARDICTEPSRGVTAWPIEQIERAVNPTAEQRQLLEELKKAAAQAAAEFRDACPDVVPMTPPGRLQAMTRRLTATLDAVKTVRPPLEAFYDSLSDEQKARFNEAGPELAREGRQADARQAQDAPPDCGGEKAGLSNLAVERIEEALQPTDAQFGALDRLSEAMRKAVDTLSDACPTTIPLTPVGRLETMQARLEAMIEAGNAVRPALEDFYAVLNNEQKAKFNRLGRETAQSGG